MVFEDEGGQESIGCEPHKGQWTILWTIPFGPDCDFYYLQILQSIALEALAARCFPQEKPGQTNRQQSTTGHVTIAAHREADQQENRIHSR